MTELDLGYRVAHRLDLGTENLPRETRERLFAARQQALAHHRRASALFSLPGFGHLAVDVLLPQARALLAIIVLVAGVAGSYYWNSSQQVAENEEVDSALLSGDLPINAYLDHGFDTWLKASSAPQPQ
ncbi:MAG: DUF3619 family protein [Rhodocyclaceae bacterium]|nr:DUF3619 family protein [Rhodocyclaceae bacterium]